MKYDNLVLIVKESMYNCYLDEKHFFSWLEEINFVELVRGDADGLRIEIKPPYLEESIRDLIGLFMRYDLDMTVLKVFNNDEHCKWIARSESYWFNKMFSEKEQKELIESKEGINN